jgi:hypothetical protein
MSSTDSTKGTDAKPDDRRDPPVVEEVRVPFEAASPSEAPTSNLRMRSAREDRGTAPLVED